MGHVTEDGEHEDTSSEAGAGIDHTSDQSIAIAIVVELVVRSQGRQGSRTNTF